MGYTNTRELSEIIFPLRTAQISPQLNTSSIWYLQIWKGSGQENVQMRATKRTPDFYQKTWGNSMFFRLKK